MRERFPQLYDNKGNIIQETVEQFVERYSEINEELWDEEIRTNGKAKTMYDVYDDVHIEYNVWVRPKKYNSKTGPIPKDFMLDKNNYRKELHEFGCFSIAGYRLRSVCCEKEFVLQCDSDYELYMIYNKLLKQKRLPPSKNIYIWLKYTKLYWLVE